MLVHGYESGMTNREPSRRISRRRSRKSITMAGMGDGYVGTAEDSARIRRMDKKRCLSLMLTYPGVLVVRKCFTYFLHDDRQEEKKKYEEAQRLRQERLDGAGLRKFAGASTEVPWARLIEC